MRVRGASVLFCQLLVCEVLVKVVFLHYMSPYHYVKVFLLAMCDCQSYHISRSSQCFTFTIVSLSAMFIMSRLQGNLKVLFMNIMLLSALFSALCYCDIGCISSIPCFIKFYQEFLAFKRWNSAFYYTVDEICVQIVYTVSCS